MFSRQLIPLALCVTRNKPINLDILKKANIQIGYGCRQMDFATKNFATDSTVRSDKANVVYRGSLTTRMKAVKIFSLTTSLTGIAAQPIMYKQASMVGGTATVVLLCGCVGFFTFITPVLLHLITKKYVTEIIYNPGTKEYTATTVSIFLTKNETKFKTSDVHVPDVPGMFTSFLVGKTPLFVEPTMFTDPEHYVKIMGYDKPIDFRLESDPARKKEASLKKK